ncbi:MAG: M23 family metallopeptidase [Bacteroidota bacterium]|nr:M23 family metallopeptidase [Bacteroidota bacterium]MDX5404199.1 M23 family metallopeptidase [Bacteroidota bacterium]MDX5427975.1 M23 family metallopeptidase [Bacteroidota bacterium]MDX5448967.1 M23 family metallopeptidase [Bacteroidota bacterium]MDX5505821.1 M23 family metallopeptidase [Bacteroidota bacterium]
MTKEKKSKKAITKLKNKYRLVVLNDETFEEKITFKLSRLNVFVAVMLGAILLIGSTILLIAFTPLREYIPGYASTDLRRKALELTLRTDSLERQLAFNEQYVSNIKNILSGNPVDPVVHNEQQTGSVEPQDIEFESTQDEAILRQFVEEEDRFNLPNRGSEPLANTAFFTPLKGLVTNAFDQDQNHVGVDITAKPNSPVKSCLEGTVILAEWTAETGYVMMIQHDHDLVSVYKHNSALLKKQGDLVRAGEAIAIIGNSGNHTTGPHLHFELWHQGLAVNPQEYISF